MTMKVIFPPQLSHFASFQGLFSPKCVVTADVFRGWVYTAAFCCSLSKNVEVFWGDVSMNTP